MESRRIERTTVNAFERLEPRPPPDTTSEKAVESLEFARLLQTLLRQRKRIVGEPTLAELVADFITPSIGDPVILSSDRAIALLEQLLTKTLPQLKESEEFCVLARAIVGQEIAQRRRLNARRRRDSAA